MPPPVADPLRELEDWAAPILASLKPDARMRLARRIGADLRRGQTQRIAQQRNPDGSAYAPRKQPARAKAGRIKRGAMFKKLRKPQFLKVRTDADGAAVEFTSRVSKIARIHQEGQRAEVRPGGPSIRYTRRELLGFSAADGERIRKLVLDHLAGA